MNSKLNSQGNHSSVSSQASNVTFMTFRCRFAYNHNSSNNHNFAATKSQT